MPLGTPMAGQPMHAPIMQGEMFPCRACGQPFARSPQDQGSSQYWNCPNCAGISSSELGKLNFIT
jgi:predicted RNA-binding Zn-ribbon protein involved in translation (DUF1610 family)